MLVNFLLFSLFIPFFSGLVILFFGNKLGFYWFFYIFIYFYFLSMLFIIIVFFYSIKYNMFIYINFFNIMNFDNFVINFDFLFDNLTIIMFFIVITISFFVNLFSFWYMLGDPNILKFFAYLNFFSFFMLILVCANNLVLIFIGWEGIGLFSYFLINFWSSRLLANRSALKAIIVNKIGDCFFYLFIVYYFFVFESFNLLDVKLFVLNFKNYNNFFLNQNIVHFMLIFMLVAAVAKSAQIILHVWLPDAMEGPTPVSALLHAATMVTAGIYLLIKFNWLFASDLKIYSFILFIGLFTNIFASLTAIFQYDIKKIIAYSTASQLGLIFLSFGLLKFNFALFHIFNHAFFKALLFILAGILIHNFNGLQDVRTFLFIKNNIFWLYFFFLIASLTLIGFPFLSAYYSKELIIQNSFFNIYISKSVFFFFLNLSVVTTIIYSLKILNFIFSNKNNVFTQKNNHKANFDFINFITFFLSFLSIFAGYFTFIIFNNDFLKFSSNFFLSPNVENNNSTFFLDYSFFFIIFLFFVLLLNFNLEIFFVKYNLYYNKFFKNMFFFFNKKWLFDNFYYYILIFFTFNINIFLVLMDKKFIESKLINISKLHTIFNKNIFFSAKLWFFYVFILFFFLLYLILYIWYRTTFFLHFYFLFIYPALVFFMLYLLLLNKCLKTLLK